MKVLSIISQKGGVGKTTTAQALSYGLAKLKKKVLLIDLDNQMNLSYSVNADFKSKNIYDVLENDFDINETIQDLNNIDFVCSSSYLVNMRFNSTSKLKEKFHQVKNDYDFVVLDTPPQLNIITINALTASDETIIASQADVFSVQGIGQLYNTIKSVQQHSNADLTVTGILITRYNARTILSRDMTDILEQAGARMNSKLFDTKIRECTAIKEAQAKQQDIFSYSKNCNASKDYNNLIKEYLKRSK